MVGGIAINTAHELGHKRKQHEQWLSKVALAQTGYGHFFIEHNRGHHVRVATPEDPASSRLGESFWEFLPAHGLGQPEVGAAPGEGRGSSGWTSRFFTIHNDVLNAWAMTVVLFGALTAIFGLEVLPWLLAPGRGRASRCSRSSTTSSTTGCCARSATTAAGATSAAAPSTPGTATTSASNVFLYHLQRHSDHHANPMRRYQALRHYEDLPELPSGYATMILLAYATPLWRRVMDPKVLAHYDGDVTRANILPRKRKRMLAKYGRRPPEWRTYRCPGCGYDVRRTGRRAPRGLPGRHRDGATSRPTGHCPDCGVREKARTSRQVAAELGRRLR